MIKNSQKQTGSVLIVIIIILVVVLVGALGFIFYQNFINKNAVTQGSKVDTQLEENDSGITTETSEYTIDDAVAGINKTLLDKGCSGAGVSSDIAKDSFEEVEDSDQYSYQGGVSRINKKLSHTYVQYGCGSQGSVALLKKTDDVWTLISEDARIYPMCASVRGQGFPASIVDKCYTDDRATEPVAI